MLRQGVRILGLAVSIGLVAAVATAFVPPEKTTQSAPATPAVPWAPGEARLSAEGGTPPTAEAGARWQAFEASEGRGFQAIWNPVTGTPHRVQGKAIKLAGKVSEATVGSLVRDFVRARAALLGADPQALRLVSQEKHGSRWYTDYQQTYQGLDVIGGRLHVRLTEGGNVTAFGSDIYPGINISAVPALSRPSALVLAKQEVGFDERLDEVASEQLVVLPVVEGGIASYSLAHEVVLRLIGDPAAGREPALWRLYLDARTGAVIQKANEIRYDTVSGTITGYIKPMYITDPDQERPFAEQYVEVVGYGQATTDQNGHYVREAGTGGSRTVNATLVGPWVEIMNNAGNEAAMSGSVAPGGELNMLWTSPQSTASERNAFYHSEVIHNFIKALDPVFTGMDRRTSIFVGVSNLCNAYWDGSSITIGAGSGSCMDLAMFCDVLYHEYGHGIADMQYRPYAPTGAMHEGFADYTACTITGEPYIGEGLGGPGTYFRTIANSLKYPGDLTGEVHDDGRILAGSLWDLRTALSPDVRLADSLFHYARYGKAQNFFDYYYDVIETDDDDGNLANGTPHYYQIVDAFGKHGIGPGLYINIAHVPVHDSEDSLAAFPVTATITSNLALDPDSLVVYYSTGGGFSALTMLPTGNPDEYSAAIPGQPVGTTISYYIYAGAAGRTDHATDPALAPATLHSFSIGTDLVAPIITHEPLVDQPDADWPPTVTATVTDNLGLASVVLEYTLNGAVQTPIAMTSAPGSDIYQAAFQGTVAPGDYVSYRIRATDASAAHHVTYAPASAYNVFGIAAATAYTFESGAEGWTHAAQSGYTDQWHISTTRNHTGGGGQSWKCGDTGGGTYGNRVGAVLDTPWIDIGQDATLTFWYWIEAEAYEPIQGSGLAWDGAAVSLVDSTGKASPIDPVGGYPYRILADSDAPFNANKPVYSGSSGWTRATFDLSAYQGRGKIRIKFGSDGAVAFEGLYVDDVSIWSQGALAGVGDGGPDGWGEPGVPARFSLAAAFPNPTVSGVSIAYAVPAAGGHVAIQVFDVRGRMASTLVDEVKPAGRYAATWDGRDTDGRQVAPGIYFVRMEASNFRAASKLVVVK